MKGFCAHGSFNVVCYKCVLFFIFHIIINISLLIASLHLTKEVPLAVDSYLL